MNDDEIELYGKKKLQDRRTKRDNLEHNYWICEMLKQEGFNLLFEKTKFFDNKLCWDICSNSEESKTDPIIVDVLESYLMPQKIKKHLAKRNKENY